jgi:hypothetical protein
MKTQHLMNDPSFREKGFAPGPRSFLVCAKSICRMKSSSFRTIAVAFAALAVPATLAQAHPGHSIFDLSIPPHAGHEGQHLTLFVVLLLAAMACAGHWFATRKR